MVFRFIQELKLGIIWRKEKDRGDPVGVVGYHPDGVPPVEKNMAIAGIPTGDILILPPYGTISERT